MPDSSRFWELAPTELAPTDDPIGRFLAEIETVSGTTVRLGPAELVGEITAQLAAAGAHRVALTADLGDARAVLAQALAEAGLHVSDYEQIAGDRDLVRTLDATVTGCLAGVAATGSIVTGGLAGRAGALVAPTHVCVVEARRVVDGLSTLMRLAPRLGAGSMMALQTGPSRTADIEKTLIIGVHGPKRVHVVLLDGVLAA
jgi:L-lactate dehydrogenase complex protein LldG